MAYRLAVDTEALHYNQKLQKIPEKDDFRPPLVVFDDETGDLKRAFEVDMPGCRLVYKPTERWFSGLRHYEIWVETDGPVILAASPRAPMRAGHEP